MKASMRLVHAVVGWVVLTLAVVVPQGVWATSRVAGVVLGLMLLGGWAFVILRAAVTLNMGLVGAGAGVLVVALTHLFGTDDFQAARKLYDGRALEDVTLADAIARREDGVWAKLTDARVRSEATVEVTLVSGSGEDADGNPQPQTEHRLAFAPLTLVADVSQEFPLMRRRPTGTVLLWACAPSSALLTDFDRERQAVRGRLAHIKPDFFAALADRLGPVERERPAGFGALPPAPGAAPDVPAAAPPERLRVGVEGWCLHLDRALTAAQAKDQAVGSVLAVIFMVPLFTAVFAAFFAFTKNE